MTGAGGRRKRRILFLLIKTALLAAAVWAVYTYIAVPHRQAGNEMFPSVKDGDLCIYYRPADPQVGDIVLYMQDGKARAGRIAARPGQTVDFPEGGGYTVDGYAPAEELPFDTEKDPDSEIRYPVVLGDGEYFILNDYRSETGDSRKSGPIGRGDVIGTLKYVIRRRGF